MKKGEKEKNNDDASPGKKKVFLPGRDFYSFSSLFVHSRRAPPRRGTGAPLGKSSARQKCFFLSMSSRSLSNPSTLSLLSLSLSLSPHPPNLSLSPSLHLARWSNPFALTWVVLLIGQHRCSDSSGVVSKRMKNRKEKDDDEEENRKRGGSPPLSHRRGKPRRTERGSRKGNEGL